MAISNTNTLSTNFNSSPYYDDFDESKRFHRILFRPGLAVQARELTQSQTILQNQIDRFAENIFKEGAIVRGGEISYDQEYFYVKLRDADSVGDPIDTSLLVGTQLTGSTSGVKAIVLNDAVGSEGAAPDYNTLFVKYTSAGTDNQTLAFADNEILVANNGLTANSIATTSTGSGFAIGIGESVVYAKDHFIRVEPQTLVVEKYSTNPTVDVGYTITETIVSSAQDTTLLDPARGSYNFTAPGADRLQLTATLSKQPTGISSGNFIKMFTIKNGIVEQDYTKPIYSQIRDYLAQRTYDESGNYVVNGLNVRIREHLKQSNNQGWLTAAAGGNTSLLALGIEPGRGYVLGYDIKNLVTNNLETPKGLDYRSIEAASISANYGNYVTVKEVCGVWDVMSHDRVSLRDEFAAAISNANYSSTAAIGNEIGTARVRAIEYASGTEGSYDATYNLHLYDITMTANTFGLVRSVYLNNASDSDCKADVVLTSNTAVLQETSFNRAVFAVPASNIRTIRDATSAIDTTFKFYKTFPVTIAVDGTFTIATGASDEQFPYSTGVLNATQKKSGFRVVLNSSGTTGALTGTASIASAANTIVGSGTAFDTDFNVGDRVALGANTFTVTAVGGATSMSVLQAAGATQSGSSYTKKFEVGQFIDMGGVGSDSTARVINITSTTGASFDIQETLTGTITASVICELNKVDGQEMAKTFRADRFVRVDINSNAGSTTGPWNLGFSDVFAIKEVRKKTGSTFTADTEGDDVTAHFDLDTGQRDNIYGHGRLRKKSTSSLTIGATDFLLVKVDYFAHDTSQGVGYFSVDSYPIDDTLVANTTAITTQEIPIYVSPTTGVSYPLRDSIDIRPRITDTAADSTTVGGSTQDPATSTVIVEPAGGLHFIPPNESMIADLDYYMKRIDLVVVDSSGKFRVIQGQPSLYPLTPPDPQDCIILAKVFIAPYPSLPPALARLYNRPELACAVTPIHNERYTMKDIGALKDRINRVEYYTSLSLLEKDAKDLLISDSLGNNRFKNGMLVDNFTGHNIGNVYDSDYSIAVDSKGGEIRPKFKLDTVELFHNGASSTNVVRAPNDATVVVTGATGTYSNGETVSTGGASGTVIYHVDDKVYIEQTTGTFAAAATLTGGSSGVTSTISTATTPPLSDLITLPYTHTKIVTQPYASSIRNAASLYYNWVADISLNPDSDYWVDTVTQPDVQINFDSNLDNWQVLPDAWGTQWNDWQTAWRGESEIDSTDTVTGTTVSGRNIIEQFSTESTLEVTETQTRTGIQTTVIPETLTQRIGARVVDVSIVPFMRSRIIRVAGSGFKPDSKLYAFFDGENVTSYITPTDNAFANTAAEGASLISDGTGNIHALFRIPNDGSLKFRIGTRSFRLTDSPTNSSATGAATTSGTADFTSQGMVQSVQGTMISTRVPQFSFNTVEETVDVLSIRTVTTEGERVVGRRRDPIAQTFKLNDLTSSNISGLGVFVTKFDLFFFGKDSTYPVYVELREVDPSTSYITNRVVPFSRVTLQPSEVNISSDSSAPTPVVFSAPVYLLNSVEYAIVVRPAGANPNYKLWVSRLGEDDIITGQRINKQPYAGMVFASGNDRAWTAIQDEDMKFNIYVATFDTSVTGLAIFNNENREFLSIANAAGGFNTVGEQVDGETTMTLSGSTTANVGTYAAGLTSTANGIVTYVSGTTIRVKDVTTANKYSDSETIEFFFANGTTTAETKTLSTQVTPTGKVVYFDDVNTANTLLHLANTSGTFAAGTWVRGQSGEQDAYIVDVADLAVDVLNFDAQTVVLDKTKLVFSGKFAYSTSAVDAAYNSIDVNKNTHNHDIGGRKYVLSKSNETTGLSGAKSVNIRGTLTSTNVRHSPIIDVKRTSFTAVENLINNDNTNENTAGGGNALAKYISRKVTLAEGQDAEDMVVYLTAYKPASSSIEVYYKILNSEDSDDFSQRSWALMEQETLSTIISDNENITDSNEYKYVIPAANLTGGGGEVQYMNSQSVTFTGYKYFAIKIVLLSSDPSNPPRVQDMRTIALQI